MAQAGLDSSIGGDSVDSVDSGGGGGGVDLTCPVCYDTFSSPRFLPCHHTLCTGCIADLMERAPALQRDFFPCPLCQAVVKIPEEGVTSFQINFYLAPLLAGRARADSGPGQYCQHCRRGNTTSSSSSSSSPAVAQCQQCAVSLCRPCIDHHLELPANAKHSFAPLTTTQQARRQPAAALQKTPDTSPSSSFDLSCEAHWSGGEMTYFCKCCACLVCRPGCQQHQGQGHAVVDVAPEARSQRSEVRRQLLSLATFQGALADLEDEGKHRVAALEDSCRQVALKMEATRQQACESITRRAGKSADKVRGLRGRISKVVEGEMRNIQEKITSLSALLASANDVMAASDAEFLRRKAKLMAKIQSVMSKVPPSRGNLHFSFKMSQDVQTLIHRDASFGYMTVQFQSPVLRHRLTLSSTKQQRRLRKLVPLGDGTVMASVGNCLVYISSDFTETKRLEFPAEVVDFLPCEGGGGGLVYVVLPFPHAVKRLDTATDVAGDFVSPLNPPTALAFTDKQELVFASNDGKELSLTFYSVGGARVKRVTLPKPDFTPISMTVTKRGHLYLCSPAEVLCLDSDFSDLAALGDLPGLEPRCLSGLRGMGSGMGDVLLANWAAGNVEIVDLCEGKLTRKQELVQWKRGISEEDVDLSKGLIHNISCAVVDPAGKLWVGQENGQVSIYDWLLRAS